MIAGLPPWDGGGLVLPGATAEDRPREPNSIATDITDRHEAATRAKVESCPHREPFTPDDPTCWCPRWRCTAGRYQRSWMKPTDGVYVRDCIACLESEGSTMHSILASITVAR
jgi:hypothetical protein